MTSFPRQLSGGEQQRVAIARAIVAEPSAILADEPTAALDAANGQAIMTILSAIAKERGSAVLVVTHDPRLFGFADRIIHIEDGALTHEQSVGDRIDVDSCAKIDEGSVAAGHPSPQPSVKTSQEKSWRQPSRHIPASRGRITY